MCNRFAPAQRVAGVMNLVEDHQRLPRHCACFIGERGCRDSGIGDHFAVELARPAFLGAA